MYSVPIGFRLVDIQRECMELNPHPQEGDRFPNTDRCLTDRLGSGIWQQRSSRPMVPRGENNAHKHTRAQSSTLWSENFCEGTLAPASLNRQHDSDTLRQQIRSH